MTETTRFKDLPWVNNSKINTIVGGAGGIGSWLVLFLNRADFNTTVYDFDTVEQFNLAGQIYAKEHIGCLKIECLEQIVNYFTGKTITGISEKFNKDSMRHTYMFSGFDNMQAREDMFYLWCEQVNNWKVLKEDCPENNLETPLFIDGRLSAENMEIYCVTPDRIEDYKKTLFKDNEVEPMPCTAKQTTHSAAMIASHMVAFFTNHITNNISKERNVPFRWFYFIPLDLLTHD